MCGFAGILQFDQRAEPHDLRQIIERMTASLAHRGPDGEGFHIAPPVALGHRRLSIIDLPGGAQPMGNETGDVHVVYNGEIYNYRELTHQLTAMGHQFRTRSDTEVIVHAYEAWGDACVERFRGMFAFAVVDFTRKRLLLARDHFGIKPLYYRQADGWFTFASELKALRQMPGPPPVGSLEAIDLFLRYQYIPAPHTIYRDTFKLLPGTTVAIDFEGRLGEPHRYWRLPADAPIQSGSPEQMLERTTEALRRSVSRHLVADVPVGVLCSGGIDSSLIALHACQLLAEQATGPVHAFTIGFDESDHDESPYARQVADALGMELHAQTVRADDLTELPDIVAHYDEPFGDSSMLPTWHVARLARQSVPVVLTGDGGDEAFAGYDAYADWLDLPNWSRAARLWRRTRGGAAMQFLRMIRRTIAPHTVSPLAQWQNIVRFVRPSIRRQLWRSQWHHFARTPCTAFTEADRHASSGTDCASHRLQYAQLMDYGTYLPNDILAKVDLAAMAHGLETRVPFVDVELVELAMTLPCEMRMQQAGEDGTVGKRVLRDLLRRSPLARVVDRPKHGFAIPRRRWFQPGKPGTRLFDEAVLSARTLDDWFDRRTMMRLLHRHHTGSADLSNPLWALLVLALWRDRHRDVPFPEPC